MHPAELAARASYGRLLSLVAVRTGDLAGAEDALAEAFLAAVTQWPLEGVPQNPEAWLLEGERLVMRTAQGPFPMETTYTWQSPSEGSTRMTLRNRGEPSGFSKLAAPLMASAMRRANRKDLEQLKAVLESR
jgi:hypothetical protein